MAGNKKSKIIYGDSPFVEDMGVLTSLCLLHDEVLLFGGNTLDRQLEDLRRNLVSGDHATLESCRRDISATSP